MLTIHLRRQNAMNKTLFSLFLVTVFLAYNIWFIGFLNRMGFSLIAQILIAYFTCSVMVFCGYFYFSKSKLSREKPKVLSLVGFTTLLSSQTNLEQYYAHLFRLSIAFLVFVMFFSIAIIIILIKCSRVWKI